MNRSAFQRIVLLGFVALLGVGLGTRALAQPKPENEETRSVEQARAQFNKGVDLAEESNFREAITLWLDVVDRLPPEDLYRAHKALGLAYKKLGMLPEAWYYLTHYLESNQLTDPSAGAWLEEVEEGLRKDYVRVSFTCSPRDTTLRIEDKGPAPRMERFPCPLSWWFKPGKQTVLAEAKRHDSHHEMVDVRARGDAGVRMIRLRPSLGGETSEETPITKPVPSKPSEPSTGRRSRVLEWSLLGSGLTMGIVGGVLNGLSGSKNNDLYSKYGDRSLYPDASAAEGFYSEAYDEQVQPMLTGAYVLYGLAGAAVVTGGILWWVRKDSPSEEPVSFLPFVSPDSSGFVLNWSW